MLVSKTVLMLLVFRTLRSRCTFCSVLLYLLQSSTLCLVAALFASVGLSIFIVHIMYRFYYLFLQKCKPKARRSLPIMMSSSTDHPPFLGLGRNLNALFSFHKAPVILLCLPGLVALCLIKHLKYLAPFSLVAEVSPEASLLAHVPQL